MLGTPPPPETRFLQETEFLMAKRFGRDASGAKTLAGLAPEPGIQD